jgi:hypothetical protein
VDSDPKEMVEEAEEEEEAITREEIRSVMAEGRG